MTSISAALFTAPAKLDHAARGHAAVGNAARQRRVGDGAGTGSEAFILVELTQPAERAVEVEGRVLERRTAQVLRQFQCQASDGFLGILDHHLVHAGFDRGRGAAEGDGAARLGLQAQRREFQHVGQRHGLVVARGVERQDLRESSPQAHAEVLAGTEFALGRRAVDDGLDGGVVAPQIGATQGANTFDFHEDQ